MQTKVRGVAHPRLDGPGTRPIRSRGEHIGAIAQVFHANWQHSFIRPAQERLHLVATARPARGKSLSSKGRCSLTTPSNARRAAHSQPFDADYTTSQRRLLWRTIALATYVFHLEFVGALSWCSQACNIAIDRESPSKPIIEDVCTAGCDVRLPGVGEAICDCEGQLEVLATANSTQGTARDRTAGGSLPCCNHCDLLRPACMHERNSATPATAHLLTCLSSRQVRAITRCAQA